MGAESHKIERLPIKAERVAAVLKERGWENEQAQALFYHWLDMQEERVTRGEITFFDCIMATAEVYAAAGMIKSALEALNDAADAAVQENDPDGFERVEAQMYELTSKE